MQGMTKLLSKSSATVNMNNIQQTIEGFNMQLEQQNSIGEMMQDAFEEDEEEIEDQQVNQLIDDVEGKVGGGGKGGMKNKNTDQTQDFDNMLNDLKK